MEFAVVVVRVIPRIIIIKKLRGFSSYLNGKVAATRLENRDYGRGDPLR
jgi:hypothetical protein